MRRLTSAWRLRLALLGVGMWVALVLSATAFAAVVQQGTLRISIATQLQPYKLPRTGTAPIKVFIAGHIATSDGSTPPQLQRMQVLINRHGVIDPTAVPSCRLSQLRSASNEEALAHCAGALVGSGHFWATILFPGQPPFHTTGRLLAFNGVIGKKPVFFAHIYTTLPFPSAFVVSFSIRHISRGPYGTELSASLPQSLGEWGYVNRIKMTLGREVRSGGHAHSYLNAGCPAPKGFHAAVFPLAFATFSFAAHEQLSTTISRPCGVSE